MAVLDRQEERGRKVCAFQQSHYSVHMAVLDRLQGMTDVSGCKRQMEQAPEAVFRY